MRNKEVARLLESIADALDIKGETPFRVNAYREAARRIETLTEDVAVLAQEDRLQEIQGVGSTIATRIKEYLTLGRSPYYEELAKEVPPGLLDLLKVPGLGPRKAKLVYERLGIASLAELERAAREHRLADLPGMGRKTEENLLRELERLKQRTQRLLLGTALPAAERVVDALREHPAVARIAPAGSLRRMRDTIGDIDILVASTAPDEVIAAFVSLPLVKEVIARGPTKSSVLTEGDVQMDLRVVDPHAWGAALQYFTGSKAHNVHLRELANRQGLKISEYGVFREDTGDRVAGAEEEEVYAALGLAWIPPELREDQGEIEAAREGSLPRLIAVEDLRGDLHAHTNWSDGAATLEEMARAARARGYQYLAVTDHSKSLGVARGLSEERLREQRRLIDRLNQELAPFRLLASVELEIRADGTLDYEDDVLRELDLVTASVHSGMNQPRERLTQRIVGALRNPYVDVVNHPAGRLIGRRDAYEVDLEEVLRVAAETGTALEINSQPERLDLTDQAARRARALGVLLTISTDAHSVANLDYVRYGVAVARRAWVEAEGALNTRSLDDLLAHVARRRARAGAR